MSEPQIVPSYDPDSLGSVWAALGALLRPQDHQRRPTTSSSSGALQDEDGLEPRTRRRPEWYGNPVPTESIELSSSPSYPERPSTSGTTGAASSIGYTENPPLPAVEDLTLRLASCFVRYVLDYSQEHQSGPVLEFRDERVSMGYQFSSPRSTLLAVDDGGIRMSQAGEIAHVALVEAKR